LYPLVAGDSSLYRSLFALLVPGSFELQERVPLWKGLITAAIVA
jgi:hypothetical protein